MSIKLRRIVFGTLVLATMTALAALFFYSISYKGISVAEWILFACFMVTLPWTVIGFWNAVIGFILMRASKTPAEHVFPMLAEVEGDEPITTSTAIAMCIRNEEIDQVLRNLNAMISRLVASGKADRFHFYVLSDSSFDDIIPVEEQAIAQLKQEWAGKMEITYRRRLTNPGFKAGNLRDFCDRWGNDHDFLLTLDADSVMSATAILRLVRVMQKQENLGILQSLVVGMPSESAFTRSFQFGMRMGMKSYTIGSAWWQADCGPYWGHNALIRLKPFAEHCDLPRLAGTGPLAGDILSHDQVEAVYMRRAGYECRVLADESGSYEENPPHILEFIRRDLRWCHGNMQYFKLLSQPGLYLTSRIQLLLAILMFTGSPAWMIFVSLGTLGFVMPSLDINFQVVGAGYTLFAIIMIMIFAPKITSFADALINPVLARRYGGRPAIVFSAVSETIFSMMLAPIMAVANTIFMFRLFVLRKSKGWLAQARGVEALPLSRVAFHLWPQMLFGLVGFAIVITAGITSLTGLLICLPVFVGPLLAIPFGYSSSQPVLGRLAARFGVWQIPEEERTEIVLRRLQLPALAIRQAARFGTAKAVRQENEALIALDAEAEKPAAS